MKSKTVSFSLIIPLSFFLCDSVLAHSGTHVTYNPLETSGTLGYGVGLQYVYEDQSDLRAGRKKTEPGGELGTEDELRTLNKTTLMSIDYNPSPSWGVNVLVPFVQRFHSLIKNDVIPEEEHWNLSGLGDIRIVSRYQATTKIFNNTQRTGIKFGIKTPTGSYNKLNDHGEAGERSIQPGTGTTDIILGAYTGTAPSKDRITWFSHITLQAPMTTRDDFRPGEEIAIEFGGRFRTIDSIHATLQVNAIHRGRDRGSNAHEDDSGHQYVYLTPGFEITPNRGFQIYAYVQLPIYQSVNGVQLVSRYIGSLGINYQF